MTRAIDGVRGHIYAAGMAEQRYHLAQVNIAVLQAPLDSLQLTGFVAALEPINALADSAPGFVWRLQTEDGDATAIRPFDDDRMMVNMSLWESIEALGEYVYRSDHTAVMVPPYGEGVRRALVGTCRALTDDRGGEGAVGTSGSAWADRSLVHLPRRVPASGRRCSDRVTRGRPLPSVTVSWAGSLPQPARRP